MTSQYFVIRGYEDGGCSCRIMSEEEILKGLVPDDNGNIRLRDPQDELPADISNFVGTVIIRGHLVVPQPKEIVISYQLPSASRYNG